MRKTITFITLVFTLVLFVNCTDNSLEHLNQNESQSEKHIKFEKFHFTDPQNNGSKDDEDDEETGE